MKNEGFRKIEKSPEAILKDFFGDLESRRRQFTEYKKGGKFTILRHKSIPGLELAQLTECSDPHHHDETYFCFLEVAEFQLGKPGGTELVSINAEPGKVYHIAKGAPHAAGPLSGKSVVELLIYNPQGTRDRGENDYPEGTKKLEQFQVHKQ